LTPHLIEFTLEIEGRSTITDISDDEHHGETRPKENSVNGEEGSGVEESAR